MFESNVHYWASLVIPEMGLKKPKHAQMCPGETKAKTAAAMFSGHKWMSLCVPTCTGMRPQLCCQAIMSPDAPLPHLVAHGLTWLHLVALGLIWLHLDTFCQLVTNDGANWL